MRLDEYAALDGVALADLVRRGAISAVELARTARDAIAAVNPTLNAVIEVYDDAPAAAATVDRAAPFAGVPFLVKDIGFHFAGRKVELGSRLCAGLTVAEDSFFGRLVKATGVTLMGRSNTPEFSMALCAENLLHGATSNPWKRGYSTSGSSGGAGAAVAAGIVPIAHASDMGGSIRGPAAWCGTVGLFPSRARVSSGPLAAEAGNGMSQAFVVTRTVRDTAHMLDHLSVPQPGDPFVIRQPSRPFGSYVDAPARGLRVAFSAKPLMDAPVDPEIAALVTRTANILAGLGHRVEEAAPDIDLAYLDAACTDIWYYGFDRYLDALGRRMGRTVGPDTVEKASLAFYHYARARSVEKYFDGLDAFNRIRRRIGPFFERFDAWLTPTCAQVARPFGTYGMNIDVAPEDFLVHEQRPCQFMIAYNVTGQPAVSLPLGQHSSGLPIGVQLGARHGEEHVLIGLAAELERAMPWHDRVPPIHVTRPD